MKRFDIPFWLLGLAILAIPVSVRADKMVVLYQGSIAVYQDILKGLEQDGQYHLQINALGNEIVSNPKNVEKVIPADAQALMLFSQETLGLLERNLPPIPVVYTMVLAPYEFRSPRPAGCVLIQPALEKQFEAIARMLPGLKKMLVIYNPEFSSDIIYRARRLAGDYGFTLLPVAVTSTQEALSYLAGVDRQKAEILWSVLDRTVSQPEVVRKTIETALQQKIPFIGQTIFHVKAGALAAVCSDFTDIGAQAAQLARKLSASGGNGQKVEPPRKIVIYTNRTVQKNLELKELTPLPEMKYID